MLNLKEAAEKMGLSIVTLRRYIKQGKFKATKIGKSYFIKEEDIEELKSEHGLKSEADSLVHEGIEGQKDAVSHHTRKEVFRKAIDIYIKLDEKQLAEEVNYDSNIFGFSFRNLMRKDGYEEKQWGRFAPMMSGTDKDGNVFYSPDPSWIDEKMLIHAEKRTSEVVNPLTLAVYYDLLFEHSKEKNKLNFALGAIENYSKSAEIYYLHEDRMFECLDSITRIFEIALKINSNDEISKAVQLMASYIERIIKDGRYRFSLELLQIMVKYRKHLNENQLNLIFKTAEICSSYFASMETPNRFLQRPFLEIAADLSQNLERNDDYIKYNQQIADSFIQEAEERAKEGGFIRAHLLEQAYGILQKTKSLGDNKQKLSKQIEDAYVDSEKDMKPISVEVKIPQKKIDDFLSGYIKDDANESFMIIGASPVLTPTLDEAEKRVKSDAKRFPLQHLLPRAIIQDGKKIRTISGGDESSKDKSIAALGRDIYLSAVLLGFIFETLKKKGINGKSIAGYIKDKDFYQYDNFGAIEQGLEVLDQENYFSAMNTLVPQIEELLRKVLRRLGKPSSKVEGDGTQRALYINEVLESLRPDLGEDCFWYLYLVLHDKRGPAIRNNLAHGLYKVSSSNKQDSYIILHVLLMLANFSIQKK